MFEGPMKEKHVKAGLAGGLSKEGKMLEGPMKEKHVKAGLRGGASKEGKMLEGPMKEKHVKAGVARGVSKSGKMESGEELKAHLRAIFKGKMAARRKLLHQLTITKGEQWRIVAARAEGSGKMKHNETANVGDKLKPNYKWCFCNGCDTLTSKRVKKMLKK